MKKNPILLLMPAAILGVTVLSGCGEQAPTLNLVNSESQFVVSWTQDARLKLPTYELSNRKGLPYSRLSDFMSVVGAVANVSYSVERSQDGTSTLRVANSNDFIFKVNPEKDTLEVGDTIAALGSLYAVNNGVTGDYGAPNDDPLCLVHTSKNTKIIGTPKAEIHQMKDYGMDFVEQDGQIFMPTQLLGNLVTRGIGIDFVHNGRDLYLWSSVSQDTGNGTSFYSANGQFSLVDSTGIVHFNKTDLRTDRYDGREEVYRFSGASKSLEDGSEGTCYLVLFKDGKGQRTFSATGNPSMEKEDFNPGTMGYSYEYEWQASGNDGILVSRTIVQQGFDGEQVRRLDAKYRINLGSGWYNAKTRPQGLVDFAYGLLKYEYEAEYGLKEEKKISSAETFFQNLGIKDALKSADCTAYDDALAKLTMGGLDDGHTLYVRRSVFAGPDAFDNASLAKKHMGPRYKALMEKSELYNKYRDDYFRSLGTPEETEKYFSIGKTLQKGLFKHESTAIIRFDAFATGVGDFIKRKVPAGEKYDPVVEAYSYADTDNPAAFLVAFNQISKDPKIKDVVIDLTCNGGGQIASMPFLSAFFTDDPQLISIDPTKEVVRDYHYAVDLNNDGIYGGEGDTYKGKYNYYILTSDFSFSCGNAFPGLAKGYGAKIIGIRSAGGGCSVAGYSDGCGSFFNYSSHYQMGRKDGDKYVTTDGGIPLDKEWNACADWYDPAKVHAFIQGMK